MSRISNKYAKNFFNYSRFYSYFYVITFINKIVCTSKVSSDEESFSSKTYSNPAHDSKFEIAPDTTEESIDSENIIIYDESYEKEISSIHSYEEYISKKKDFETKLQKFSEDELEYNENIKTLQEAQVQLDADNKGFLKKKYDVVNDLRNLNKNMDELHDEIEEFEEEKMEIKELEKLSEENMRQYQFDKDILEERIKRFELKNEELDFELLKLMGKSLELEFQKKALEERTEDFKSVKYKFEQDKINFQNLSQEIQKIKQEIQEMKLTFKNSETKKKGTNKNSSGCVKDSEREGFISLHPINKCGNIKQIYSNMPNPIIFDSTENLNCSTTNYNIPTSFDDPESRKIKQMFDSCD